MEDNITSPKSLECFSDSTQQCSSPWSTSGKASIRDAWPFGEYTTRKTYSEQKERIGLFKETSAEYGRLLNGQNATLKKT